MATIQFWVRNVCLCGETASLLLPEVGYSLKKSVESFFLDEKSGENKGFVLAVHLTYALHLQFFKLRRGKKKTLNSEKVAS